MNASLAQAPAPVDASPAKALLAALAAGRPTRRRVALAVAHPDDEAIGAGGQMALLPDLTVIVASDGSPRDMRDARRLGLASRAAYAQARRRELHDALAIGGVEPARRLLLDLPDGDVVFALNALIVALRAAFEARGVEVVLTHAYEGGHPDHDAVALACHVAAARCAAPPAIVEMPFYRAAPHGWALQSFAEGGPPAQRMRLGAAAFARKCAMLDAHRTQAHMLRDFRQPYETFRPTPAHDFTAPPNDGRLLYAQVAPSLDPARWLAQARRVLS